MAGWSDWVWMFNDDDFPEPDALATMLAATEGLPSRTGIVGCARRDETGNPYGLGLLWRDRHIPVLEADPDGPPLAVDVVAFSGTLVAGGLVRQVGVPKPQFFMMARSSTTVPGPGRRMADLRAAATAGHRLRDGSEGLGPTVAWLLQIPATTWP